MKRSRSEHVMSAIGHYLRKRQYTDTETYKKNDLKLQQTVQEMALQGAITNESGVKNVITFSSINRDVTAIDQQFTRLKSFISEAVEPYKTELTYILFPVFVHLYLELVINGQKTPAQKFRNRHQGLFTDMPDYKGVIESLSNVSSSQDLAKYPNIKAFRDNKYSVKLSEDVVDYLVRYLKGNDHLILLQILNLYIEVRVQDPGKINLLLYEDRKADSAKDKTALKNTIDNNNSKSDTGEVELKGLQDAIRKVQDGPPSLPSICLYSFVNTSHGLSSVSVSTDISLLAAGYEDSAIRLWSLTPTPLTSTFTPHGVSHIHLACDDNILHRSGKDDQNEEELKTESEMKTLRAHSGPIYGTAFVPGSHLLLSCSEDTTVRVWSTESYSNVALYRGHSYPIWDIDCSHMGLYFATGSQDRTAKLWYLDRTYPMRIFAGHSLDVDCVKFHPNSNYLATGSSDKSVRLWSIQDGKLVRMFQGHRGTVFSLAFSPNGQMLASAGEDRRIRIWDLAAGNLMKELRGHVDTVYSLCFSRDSSALASGGLDGTIRLWDIRKGASSGSPVDSHTSPELLSSFPSKSTGLHLLYYSMHNMLVAVGGRTS